MNILRKLLCKLWLHNDNNIEISTSIYRWYNINYKYCNKCWKLVWIWTEIKNKSIL